MCRLGCLSCDRVRYLPFSFSSCSVGIGACCMWLGHISFLPPAFRESGNIKTHSSVCLFLCPSVRLSVTKTLTWFISSEVLMIEHWYLACMINVTNPFYWYHAVTLTLNFDPSQGQICCQAGDHNSSNLLVSRPTSDTSQFLRCLL